MTLSHSYYILFVILLLWTIPWKGVALWRSARNGQKVWFIVMLILNTAAVLEIIYIFFFSKKYRDRNSNSNW